MIGPVRQRYQGYLQHIRNDRKSWQTFTVGFLSFKIHTSVYPADNHTFPLEWYVVGYENRNFIYEFTT